MATSFGYLISCASSNVSMALSVGPPVIIPFLIFGGFFLNSASVPTYFLWLSYMSWFRYGNEALLINQWEDVEAGQILCTRSNSTCPSSGAIVLETFNFKTENFYYDIGALLGLMLLFRCLSLVCLKYKSASKEWIGIFIFIMIIYLQLIKKLKWNRRKFLIFFFRFFVIKWFDQIWRQKSTCFHWNCINLQFY